MPRTMRKPTRKSGEKELEEQTRFVFPARKSEDTKKSIENTVKKKNVPPAKRKRY